MAKSRDYAWAIAGVLDWKSMAQPHIEEIDDAVKTMGDALGVEIFYDSHKHEGDYPNDGYTQAINELHEAYEKIKAASYELTMLLGGE